MSLQTYSYIILFFCISFTTASQSLKEEEFNELYFSENFDHNRRGWLILNSQDNFFIIKDGFYELQRRNEQSSDIVLCPFTSKVSDFQLSARFTLHPFGVYPTYAGIIFNATKDGFKAVAFEVSTQREFRIRKLNGTTWLFLTSGGTVQGWQKTNSINSSSSEIELLVQTKNDVFDFYINGNFVISQTITGASIGNFGITVGPASKVKVDELTMMTTTQTVAAGGKKEKETGGIKNELTQKNMTEKEKIRNTSQSERIAELEKELEQIKKKAEALEQENAILRNQDENARVTELNKTIMQLQTALNKSYRTLDSIKAFHENNTPENHADTEGNKPFDQYLHQKYTVLVKENIALKNEIQDLKNNSPVFSSASGSGVSSSEIMALKEQIKALEEQLRLSNKYNLDLLKEKNSPTYAKNKISISEGGFHIVQKGETLYRISKKYPNVTVNKIMQWNGLNDTKVSIGQRLRVK